MRAEELKGHLDALLLAALEDGPRHGYAVIEALRQNTGGWTCRPGRSTRHCGGWRLRG
jgi:DNA-binding PadR family transcriptional regulator